MSKYDYAALAAIYASGNYNYAPTKPCDNVVIQAGKRVNTAIA